MILADTSAVIDLLNDRSGILRVELSRRIPLEDLVIAFPTRMEVLMGARDDRDWQALEEYLAEWVHLEIRPDDWTQAARIYADLRKTGFTLGAMDCCIAQAALSRRALLLHRDGDFDLVAQVRPTLRLERISIPPKR